MQRFLHSYKEGTRDVYKQAICSFLETVYDLPYKGYGRDAGHLKLMNEKSIEYLASDRDHFDDLLTYLQTNTKLAPKTKRGHLSTVIYWLELNENVLKRAEREFLTKQAGSFKAITEDYPISCDEIRRWYEHLSRMGRVLLLVQMSSGMRIGEVLALTPDDVNLDASPVEVKVSKTKLHSGEVQEHTKNKTSRYTFISSEAALAVREWLLVRDAWLKTSSRRTFKGEDAQEDTRIFPTAHTTVQEMYTRGLKKAGLFQVDRKTGQATISSRALRRYFTSQMKTAMSPDMVEELIGHEGYLSSSYRRYPVDQVRQAYQNAEYTVSLNAPDMKEIRETKDRADYMMSEYVRQGTRITALEETLSEYKDYLSKIKSHLKG